jgi:hypothetical protein
MNQKAHFIMVLQLVWDGSHQPKNREIAMIKCLLPRKNTIQRMALWILLVVKGCLTHLHVQWQDPKVDPSHTTLTRQRSIWMMHMADTVMMADRNPRLRGQPPQVMISIDATRTMRLVEVILPEADTIQNELVQEETRANIHMYDHSCTIILALQDTNMEAGFWKHKQNLRTTRKGVTGTKANGRQAKMDGIHAARSI